MTRWNKIHCRMDTHFGLRRTEWEQKVTRRQQVCAFDIVKLFHKTVPPQLHVRVTADAEPKFTVTDHCQRSQILNLGQIPETWIKDRFKKYGLDKKQAYKLSIIKGDDES